jgi:hypothetical protein
LSTNCIRFVDVAPLGFGGQADLSAAGTGSESL